MFILDTNVLSELRRPERTDRNMARWAGSVAAEMFFVSAISIFELELGILRVARRDQAQARVLRRWIEDQILPRFEKRILAVDGPVALRCAALPVPDPRSERDAFIAATALVHGMTVVTRNTEDFSDTGARVLDPWRVRA